MKDNYCPCKGPELDPDSFMDKITVENFDCIISLQTKFGVTWKKLLETFYYMLKGQGYIFSPEIDEKFTDLISEDR